MTITIKNYPYINNAKKEVSNTGIFLGQFIYSILPIKDASVHLLDGSLIAQDGIYSDFTQYLKEVQTENICLDLFKTEEQWQEMKTQFGEVPCFVVDDTSNTIRLPLIINPLSNVSDISQIGNLIKAGLPNIVSTIIRGACNSVFDHGALYTTPNSTGFAGGKYWFNDVQLNLSKGNNIYGNSNTVQPQSAKCCYYIVLSIRT